MNKESGNSGNISMYRADRTNESLKDMHLTSEAWLITYQANQLIHTDAELRNGSRWEGANETNHCSFTSGRMNVVESLRDGEKADIKMRASNFPGGPIVGISPSHTGEDLDLVNRIPGQAAKTPRALRPQSVLVTQLCPTICYSINFSPQAPLSMEFSRQEYWSGLPCPLPGNLPDRGIHGVGYH